MNVIGKLGHLARASRGYRSLHVTRVKNGYEAPGKTTVTFISKEIGKRLLVSHCDELGFTFNTGTRVIGPMVLFPRHAICWNIESSKHITDASLSLFRVLEPKPDLLIIGLDRQYDFAYIRSLRERVQKLGITTEIISVYNACTAFNFVNEDGRYVVAALVPMHTPKPPPKLTPGENVEQITS